MRTPAQIVRAHQNLWKPQLSAVETTSASSLKGPHDRRAVRELKIGTEPSRKSVRQNEDDRGPRDNQPIWDSVESG
jgi:hypothetical protein